jgi:hypothetical protein
MDIFHTGISNDAADHPPHVEVRTAHDIFSGLSSNYRTNTGRPIVVPQQEEDRTSSTSTTTKGLSTSWLERIASESPSPPKERTASTSECDAPISHFYTYIYRHIHTYGHHGQDRIPVLPLPPVEMSVVPGRLFLGPFLGRCLGPSVLIIVVVVGAAKGSDADISCDRGSGSVAGPSTSSSRGSLRVLVLLLLVLVQ